MTSFKPVAILATILLAFSTSFAQSVLESPYNNRAILRHYPSATLIDLQQNDPSKLDLIMYYFNESYDVQLMDCAHCDIDYDVLLNQEMFNIVNFEHLRQPAEEVLISFKEDLYLITLHPTQAVQSNLGTVPITEILSLKANPLPQWVSTGDNELDYATYKRALTKWAMNNPEKYRELTNGNGLIKIQISEFLILPEDKQIALSSNAQGYIIID